MQRFILFLSVFGTVLVLVKRHLGTHAKLIDNNCHFSHESDVTCLKYPFLIYYCVPHEYEEALSRNPSGHSRYASKTQFCKCNLIFERASEDTVSKSLPREWDCHENGIATVTVTFKYPSHWDNYSSWSRCSLSYLKWLFESSFQSSKSKLVCLFCRQVSVKRDLGALTSSFGKSFGKCNFEWDKVYLSMITI